MSKLVKALEVLEQQLKREAKTLVEELRVDTIQPQVPSNFKKFNKMIGLPKHPGTKKEIGILDYQQEYADAINTHHKVILNKSRKIGATETALRTIACNCFGRYTDHNVMIVAGNRMNQAIEFLDRFSGLFENGFTDMDGKKYSFSDIIPYKRRTEVRFWNGTRVTTYPALPSSLRGPQNVICVYISEAAFIDSHDDSAVYDALHPNIANIEDADFIIESTPNGRRGFFYDLFDNENEYYKLEQPHELALGKLISKEFIESERKNQRIDFEQEYCCKFTTTANAVFKPEEIKWGSGKITDWSDILGH